MNELNQGKQLVTNRLHLRPFRVADFDAYAEIMGEHEVGRWLPRGTGYTHEQTERFMTYIGEHWETHGYGIWAVTDKETGVLLGHCGLNFIKDIAEVEVLYALGQHARGQGFATEAARASLQHAMETLQLDKVIALSKPDNRASRNVIEKIGLHYVKETELFNLQLAYYAISSDEYKAQNSPGIG